MDAHKSTDDEIHAWFRTLIDFFDAGATPPRPAAAPQPSSPDSRWIQR